MDFAQKYDAFFVFMRGTLHITPFFREKFWKKQLPCIDCFSAPFPHLKIIVLTEQKPSGGTGFFWRGKHGYSVKIDGNSARLSCHPNRFLFRHPLTVEQFASQVCVCPKIPRWKKKCAGICQCSLSGREHTTGPWKMTWSLCQWFVHFLKST